jgi:hypothetical protein
MRVWGEMIESQDPIGPPMSGWRSSRAEDVRMRSTRNLPVAVSPAARRRASSARRRFPSGAVWQRMATLFMKDYKIGWRGIVQLVRRGVRVRRGRSRSSGWGQKNPLHGDSRRVGVPERPVWADGNREEQKHPHGGDMPIRFSRTTTPLERPSRRPCSMGCVVVQLEDAEHSSPTSPPNPTPGYTKPARFRVE